MKDPYKEVFESIGDVLSKQSQMIMELAKTCLTIKQYEEFAKAVNDINDKKEEEPSLDDWIKGERR